MIFGNQNQPDPQTSSFSSSSGSSTPNSPAEHVDLGAFENNIATSDLTLHETSTYVNSDPYAYPRAETHDEKNPNHQGEPLQLTEYEIICRARTHPQDTTPVVLCFGEHDLDCPRNWSKARKWYITCFVSLLNVFTYVSIQSPTQFNIPTDPSPRCLCAGGYSSTVPLLKEEYHISSTTGTLGLSTYILGFAFGPLLLAPLSEHWGRNPVYIYSWFLLFILQIPTALATNMPTIIGVRFLQGFVGSAPLTNSGGTIADLWERDQCGGPMAVYGLSSTLGPPLALPLTGYLAEREGWRVVFWFFMAVLGGAWVAMLVSFPWLPYFSIMHRHLRLSGIA